MELVLGFLLVVALLVLLDVAALRWGYNSRNYSSDWKPRSEMEYYEPEQGVR